MNDNKELIEALGTVVTEILLAHEEGFYDDGLEHAATITKAMQALSAQPSPDAAREDRCVHGMQKAPGNICGDCIRAFARTPDAAQGSEHGGEVPQATRESRHHYLKCVQPYYDEVEAKRKSFEVRLNDRDYREGDTVTLHEFVDGQWKERWVSATIGFVTDFQQKPGYVVFSLLDQLSKTEWDRQNRATASNPFHPNSFEHAYWQQGWDARDRAPQPVQKPEPVHFYRGRPIDSTTWDSWKECSKEAAEQYIRDGAQIGWQFEVKTLYTSPQPVQGVAESVADEERFNELLSGVLITQSDMEHANSAENRRAYAKAIEALRAFFKQSRQSPRAEGITQAACDVLAERQRQIEKEGWTPVHDDDEHYNHELTRAAVCYALSSTGLFNGYISAIWPWLEGDFKPKDGRRNLVRAGALILAEIERLDRESALSHSSKGDEHVPQTTR